MIPCMKWRFRRCFRCPCWNSVVSRISCFTAKGDVETDYPAPLSTVLKHVESKLNRCWWCVKTVCPPQQSQNRTNVESVGPGLNSKWYLDCTARSPFWIRRTPRFSDASEWRGKSFPPRLACETKSRGSINSEGTASSLSSGPLFWGSRVLSLGLFVVCVTKHDCLRKVGRSDWFMKGLLAV